MSHRFVTVPAGLPNVAPQATQEQNPPHLTLLQSPPKQRLDFLDRWRGLAVLVVFVYHSLGIAFGQYQPSWGNWFRDLHLPKSYLALLPLTWGWAGVSLFFVISGFCIHFSFRHGPNWGIFFQNRFFRIYPAYLVALLFFACLYPLTRLQAGSFGQAEQLVTHLLLIHNLGASFFDGINPSFWTIAIEVQLYLLYPVLLLLVKKVGWGKALIFLAAIEVSIRVVQGIVFTRTNTWPPQWLAGSPLGYWFSWAIGAALADAYLNAESLPFRGSCWTLGSFLLGVACTFIKPLSFMSFLLFSLATAGAISSALSGSGGMVMRLPRWCGEHLQRVGLWSYSLYLLHQPLLFGAHWLVYQLYVGHLHPLQTFAFFIASWIPIVGIAGLLFRFCETPSVQLGKTLRTLGKPAIQWRQPRAVPLDLS